MSGARGRAREWTLRAMLLVVVGALAWSLTYEGEPPRDAVHTHHAFRLYALGEYVEFPLFNYRVRHADVHVEPDPLAGDRGGEVIHVHRAGITFEQFLESLRLTVEEGRVCLDDETKANWAIHHGECHEDNDTHQWRLYVQDDGRPWEVAPGPFGATPTPFGTAQRFLLTHVPAGLAHDDPMLLLEQESVMPDMERWPQATAPG